MKVLVSNDDGWDAPGIRLLESVLSGIEAIGEVWTVAPATPQSGISHQMTFERPMELTRRADRRYHLTGTPADCVRVGLTQLGEDFDWVFSGVNNGGNLGVDFYISGTVAAAREATFFAKKAIALSQHRLDYPAEFDWAATRPLVRRVIENLISRSDFAAGQLANVNLPDCTNRDAAAVEIFDCEMDLSPLPYDYGVTSTTSSQDAKQTSSPSPSASSPQDLPMASPPAEPKQPNELNQMNQLNLPNSSNSSQASNWPQQLLYRGRYNDRQRQPNKDVAVCMGGNVSVVRQ